MNTESSKADVSEELRFFLDYVAGRKTETGYVRKLEDAVREAKKNREWRHEYMTLLMRDLENLEKGREEGRKEGIKEGRKEGREEGIYGMVAALKELGIPTQVILEKLQEKFHLTSDKAKKYL